MNNDIDEFTVALQICKYSLPCKTSVDVVEDKTDLLDTLHDCVLCLLALLSVSAESQPAHQENCANQMPNVQNVDVAA
jgi:hypothetical protein